MGREDDKMNNYQSESENTERAAKEYKSNLKQVQIWARNEVLFHM